MIPTTSRRSAVYTGTGAVFVYAFGFKVFQDSDVQVVVTSTLGVESTLVLGTDYTVTRNADQASFPGGTINLISALALSAKLVVIGATSYAQTTQLPTGGNYNATIVEAAMDRIVMQVQQLLELGTRTVRLPSAEVGPLVLPALATRASMFLACDAGGNIIAATGVSSTAISVAMTPVVQSATVAAARAALGSSAVGDAVFVAASAAVARLAVGASATQRVSGLVGANNTATPTTKFDLSALAVLLLDANGAAVARNNTGSITCDFGVAGPAANGRDQAGAFGVSNWVHLYFIWNPTTLTLATLASLTAPSAFTGATLPAGYTAWAYATTVRWNASSNIQTCYVRGSQVIQGRLNSGVSGASSTVQIVQSIASLVPPVALTVKLYGLLSNGSGGVGQYALQIAVVAGGPILMTPTIGVETAAGNARDSEVADIPNVGQQFYWNVDNANVGAIIDVLGYTVPNGDV